MRRALVASAALALLAATAGGASATPPGINGIFAISADNPPSGPDNIHITTSTPNGSDTRLTFDAAPEEDAAWSPDGTKIAFTSRRDGGNSEIYIMNADGSNQRRFTIDGGVDQQPTWSPDGTRLAWASDRAGNFDIWTAKTDGSDLRQLTLNGAFPDTNPEWSPDGSAIAFESNRTGGGDVYRLSPDGIERDVRRLTADGAPDGSPTWSPDGSRIAFVSGRTSVSTDIWSVSSAGVTPEAGLQRHTTDAHGAKDPVWSPDGKRIAFASFRNNADWNIWTVSATGGPDADSQQITSSVPNQTQPAWQTVAPAPATASLSPASATAGSGDLAVIVDGSNFVRRSQVRWNGALRPTQFVSSTRLTVVVPASDLAAAGTAKVDVTTSAVGGGLSSPLTFTISPAAAPGLTLTRARLQARWSASHLRGRLSLAGTAVRPALLEMRLLRASGKGKAFVVRRFRVTKAGPFTRLLDLKPALLPGRYMVRVAEAGGGASPLPTAQRATKLSGPPEGVAARAFVSNKIGGRPLRRITTRPSIIFAQYTFATLPRGHKKLTVRWFSPGARSAVAVDRKPVKRQVIAFIKSSGPLPTGTWRAELRYGGTLVATARVALR